MQIPDDERFEAYLKQFRPLLPDPLPLKEITRQRRHHLALATWAAGALAMIALVVGSFRVRHYLVSGEPDHTTLVQVHVPTQPLTIRAANALLATTPSYKSAMDDLIFPQSPTIAKDKQSALSVLAKEKIKL